MYAILIKKIAQRYTATLPILDHGLHKNVASCKAGWLFPLTIPLSLSPQPTLSPSLTLLYRIVFHSACKRKHHRRDTCLGVACTNSFTVLIKKNGEKRCWCTAYGLTSSALQTVNNLWTNPLRVRKLSASKNQTVLIRPADLIKSASPTLALRM